MTVKSFFKQFNVKITQSQHRWLKEHSDKTGESMAMFIRRAIRLLIEKENQKEVKS